MLTIKATYKGRYEWHFVVAKQCVICGLVSYSTKKSAKRAANKILEKIGAC